MIKTAIAKNIIELRKSAGLTQNELAEKLNYSDKAVSKWERGESLPDITVIRDIADMFGVTVDYMLQEEHPGAQPETEAEAEATIAKAGEVRRRNLNHLMIALISAAGVWLLATIVFTLFTSLLPEENSFVWLIYVYAVPITCIVLLVFNAMWGKRILTFVILSLLLWSGLVSVYLLLLPLQHYESIFYIGIPSQVIIALCAFIKR